MLISLELKADKGQFDEVLRRMLEKRPPEDLRNKSPEEA